MIKGITYCRRTRRQVALILLRLQGFVRQSDNRGGSVQIRPSKDDGKAVFWRVFDFADSGRQFEVFHLVGRVRTNIKARVRLSPASLFCKTLAASCSAFSNGLQNMPDLRCSKRRSLTAFAGNTEALYAPECSEGRTRI